MVGESSKQLRVAWLLLLFTFCFGCAEDKVQPANENQEKVLTWWNEAGMSINEMPDEVLQITRENFQSLLSLPPAERTRQIQNGVKLAKDHAAANGRPYTNIPIEFPEDSLDLVEREMKRRGLVLD